MTSGGPAFREGVPGRRLHRPRIVAEIGTAHGGDLERARDLIAAAGESGADTAKFQLVRASEILHPASGDIALPSGSVALFERFRELERPEEFYAQLKEECDSAGLRFLCTPFGHESAGILRRIGVEEIKIASPELNHFPLLREVSGYGLPLIISTGVSRLRDIDESLSVLPAGYPVQLLHCVTAYPAPEEDYSLRVLEPMRSLFGLPVGVSDHTMDAVLVPALSTLLGASMVEKHITISRRNPGLDDPIALEPDAFRRMASSVHGIADRLSAARTTGQDAFLHQQRTEFAALEERYGTQRVERVLGTPVKRLAPSEERNYGFTNRSIHALRSLRPGERIDQTNVAILRSEKNLAPGLHPRYWDLLQGRRLGQAVADGEGLTWDHVLSPSDPENPDSPS